MSYPIVRQVLRYEDENYNIGDLVGVIVNDEVVIGKISSIYLNEMELDCSEEYESNLRSIMLKDIVGMQKVIVCDLECDCECEFKEYITILTSCDKCKIIDRENIIELYGDYVECCSQILEIYNGDENESIFELDIYLKSTGKCGENYKKNLEELGLTPISINYI